MVDDKPTVDVRIQIVTLSLPAGMHELCGTKHQLAAASTGTAEQLLAPASHAELPG